MRRLAITSILLAVTVAATAARADAPPPEATALFEQGIKDMQAGRLDVACREIAASLAKYNDSGTKGALATCYTRAGKTASAWTLWKELADTEPVANLRADAAKQAKLLEPKLAHYIVKLAAGEPAGIVVTINGVVVPDPTLPVELPVDPGPLAVSAHAPGRIEWAKTFTASESTTTTIDVPLLSDGSHPPPVETPPTTTTPPTLQTPEEASRHRHRLYGGLLIGVGVAGLVGGAVEGVAASSAWSDAKTLCGGTTVTPCNGSISAAQQKVDDARSAATESTIFFGVGVAAVAIGTYLLISGPRVESHPATALRVLPAIGSSSAGVTLTGGW